MALRRDKGVVYLYTGDGAGKTSHALGVALRAAGHKQKAIIIQFMKGWKNTGEYLIKKKLAPNYEIHQFGREGFVDLEHPADGDKRLAREGLGFARKCLEKKPDLLVLDEINLACAIGLLPAKDVLELLKSIPKKTAVILTGRYAPPELVDRADFVTEVVNVKRLDLDAREGIEY